MDKMPVSDETRDTDKRGPQRMRIVLFIGSMETGGAETQMGYLAESLELAGHEVTLLTLYPGGGNWRKLQRHKVVTPCSLYAERPRSRLIVWWQMLIAARKLRAQLKNERRVVLYSMLYLTNFIAWLACRGQSHVRLTWGIRAGDPGAHWKRRFAFHLCRLTSATVPLGIVNSHSGLVRHREHGFNCHAWRVIANGIDTDTFHPCSEQRARVRAEWGIDDATVLIGLVARVDPIKDHPTFLQAAAQISKLNTRAKFVCVGTGPGAYTEELNAQACSLGIQSQILWVGYRDDMQAVYNALDVVTLASRFEGFPNAIAEAMACGKPCVATDVGDVSRIIDDSTRIVPVGDPLALAHAWQQVLESSHQADEAQRARRHIVEKFGQRTCVRLTEESLRQVLFSALR